MDARLKGFSIESKNTQNGLWTKKLWSSEVGGHNQKICLKEQCQPGCCTPCVLLHFGLISKPKGFEIWIYLFQGDMFSYESSLPINLNHSIRMSDDQNKNMGFKEIWTASLLKPQYFLNTNIPQLRSTINQPKPKTQQI